MKPSALLIGVAAGLASALLFAGLVTQSPSAVGLSLAAPLPIMLASLGWGSLAGFAAAISSAVIIAVFTGSFAGGMMLFASMAFGSAVLGHLAGLARPIEEAGRAPPPTPSTAPAPSQRPVASSAPALDWYPLARILMAAALLVAGGCLVLGWMLGFDPAAIAPEVEEALLAQADGALDPATRAQVADLSEVVVAVVPFAQPAFLVFTLTAALYLAAGITRASGRLMRPKDDVPQEAGLPRASLAIFAIALAGSFLGGMAGAVAAVFAGAFGAAFTLVGLAAFHRRTRGRPARGLLLFTVYTAIILLSFPLLAFLVFGVVDTARIRAAAGGSNA